MRPGRAGVGCSGQNKPWPRKGGLVPPRTSCGQSKHCLTPGWLGEEDRSKQKVALSEVRIGAEL